MHDETTPPPTEPPAPPTRLADGAAEVLAEITDHAEQRVRVTLRRWLLDADGPLVDLTISPTAANVVRLGLDDPEGATALGAIQAALTTAQAVGLAAMRVRKGRASRGDVERLLGGPLPDPAAEPELAERVARWLADWFDARALGGATELPEHQWYAERAASLPAAGVPA